MPNPLTVDDWIACIDLPEFYAMIPAGHIVSIAGVEQWVDGNGTHLSKEAFIQLHGVDPEVVWKAKKEYIRTHGGGVHKEAF